MTPQGIKGTSPLGAHLSEAQSRAEAGNYIGALNAVREAKTLEPKNIYVLAFEKQAEQLSSLSAAKSLTEEQRTDILESIPAIIERALEASKVPLTVTDLSGLKPGADATQEKKEKAAALEWLKNQYFQHAHEYVRKGEYQHALAEIRRVYIIDPNNRVAKDFEKQIDQLAALKTGQSTKMQTFVGPAPAPPQTGPSEAPSGGGAGSDSESVPTLTEEWSSPQQLVRDRKKPRPRPPVPPRDKKSSRALIILICIALTVLALVIVWIYQRNNARRLPERSSLPPPATEHFVGAPSQTSEQTFVVSPSDSDTTAGTPNVTESPAQATPTGTNERDSLEPSSSRSRTGSSRGQVSQETNVPDDGTRAERSAPIMATQTAPPENPGPPPTRTPDTASMTPFVARQREARIIKLERAKFSTFALQQGVEGQIVLQVQIDPSGKPIQTVTLKSTNDLLIQPVIEAVMKSQFAPAEMSTGPITSWLTIPFKFSSAPQ